MADGIRRRREMVIQGPKTTLEKKPAAPSAFDDVDWDALQSGPSGSYGDGYLNEIGNVSGLSGVKGFLNREIVSATHEATDGVLGATCNLIKWAVQRALLEGRDELLVEDLSVSADKNFLATGLTKSNPFITKSRKPLGVAA